MLVLARRIGEAIRIGEDVIVRVVQIQHGKIRLAIEAPKQVPIDRQEVRARRQFAKKSGSEPSPSVTVAPPL